MSGIVVASSPVPSETSAAVSAALTFHQRIASLERELRRARVTVPPEHVRREVASLFWELLAVLRTAEQEGISDEEITRCREIVGRWLFRARIFNRAYHKPHGYAGDFVMVEWMYDLESDPCALPHQPGLVNCLDDLAKTVHSIIAVWERRRHLATLLREEHAKRGGAFRVLDVAGGGARYIRDFLQDISPGPDVAVTILDQDSAAIAYCKTQSLRDWPGQVRLVDAPIRDLPRILAGDQFDVIISAGLFDYLEDADARRLLTELANRLAPGGILAFTNFHPEDPSRLVKAWLVDWPLIYRDEDAVAGLLPDGMESSTSRSANGSLVFVRAIRPAG